MPNKPTRVRYSGVGTFIDDVQGNRVTAFGSSTRLTTEDMKELGTLNIVEIVDDVPQVDVSIDQNENGTNDLLALFANKGYGCQVVAIPSGNAIGSDSVKVLQGVYKTSAGHPIFFEGGTIAVASGGNQKVYLNPVPTGGATAKLGVTGGSIPTGAVQVATVSGSSTISQADITDARTFNSISHLDYELSYVDIYVPVKESKAGVSATGGTISRTMYMEKAYVNNIDLNFQTRGTATISYRLEADNKRWFLNAGAQIIVDQSKSGGGTSITLSKTPNALANGNKLLCLYQNGVKLVEGTDFTVSGTTVTLTSSATSGDLFKARYTVSSGGQSFVPVPVSETPHPELAGGLKEGQIEIYLSDDTSNRLVRVQSARISLPLSREQLGELGALRPYDRPLQLPVNTTIDLEFRDSDLETFARLSGKDVNSDSEIAIEDLVKDLGLTVKIYRENDIVRAKLPSGHPNKYAIKTYSVTNLIPQSENWDVRTDSDATQTFGFMAHNLTIDDSITA